MAAAPMTYLELVQRLVSELGVELPALITSVAMVPPTSYGGTTEFRSKCVDWVRQAWLEIQDDQTDWDFMRATGMFDLTPGQPRYDISLQPGLEDYESLRPFVAPVDRRYIWLLNDSVSPMLRTKAYYVAPEMYFGHYDRTPQAPGQSARYTIDPAGCIILNPAPGAQANKLEFQYQREAQQLTGDGDKPIGLPPQYHMAIVYKAMSYYAGFDETQPQYSRAISLGRKMMNKLYLRHLPEYHMTGTR